MPNGEYHHNMWKAGAIVALPASLVCLALIDIHMGLGMIAGYAIGNYIDPDLDQVGITASEGRMMNDFKIFGYPLVGYWTIYGAVFRRHHRSFLTHFPVVSTSIRLAYLFWWCILVYRRFGISFNVNHAFAWLGILVGLSIADGLHYAADKLYSSKEPSLSNSNVKTYRK